MIHKLRKKFILINMGLVSTVMVIVFLSILLFNSQWQKSESIKSMEHLLFSPINKTDSSFVIGKDKGDKPGPMIPAFSVTLDESGDIITVRKENVTISDATLQEVTNRVQESGDSDGIFFDLRLRYITRQTEEGTVIAFADLSREWDSLLHLISTLLLVGVGGLIAFYAVSLYLSRWALRPVEQAWEKQRQFVADASHELKTPLTVILANMGILLSHKDDTIGDHRKWIDNTQTEANRMRELVDSLLFLAKSDAQQETMGASTLNFSQLTESCLLPFESIAFEAGISIESNIAPNLFLSGNEAQLKQLVVLLLDNACKYAGEKGQVTVQLQKEQDQIRLAIHNTGEPIPLAHQIHIFERFYRSDYSRARDQGGYGLGLAIGDSIVSNHHGRITLESNLEKGTTFVVKLPITQ